MNTGAGFGPPHFKETEMELKEAFNNIVQAHETYFRGLPAEQRAIQQSLEVVADALKPPPEADKEAKPKKKEPDGNN